jgi:hypothetical protein
MQASNAEGKIRVRRLGSSIYISILFKAPYSILELYHIRITRLNTTENLNTITKRVEAQAHVE